MASGVEVAERDGFRADINGLRAWAVVAVVLYHFQVPGFGGGFAGVDVFFVISGFLMAGIVIGALEGERFSLPGFYLARARRILPALVVLAVILLLAGWLLLMPHEYQTLGKHVRDSLFFSSNLRYLDESGYFDSASHEKWLLHTWSLSVEWQFYLAYPLLLVVARILPGRRSLLWVHILALLVSFAVCQVLSAGQPAQAFFLLQSRAWELLAGGMVFLFADKVRLPARWLSGLELLGVTLIVIACTLVDASVRWPGSAVLLPVSGAALILLAHRKRSLWTGSVIAQWLGTRSYSIYLWHWPLVVGLVYLGGLGEPLWTAAGLLFSLLLGHLSYIGVEVPARRWLTQRSSGSSATWLVASVAIVAAAAQLVRRDGFPERLPEKVARIEAESRNRNPRGAECFGAEASCTYGGAQVSALVIGDSHANALVSAVAASLPPNSQKGVYFQGVPACLMVFSAQATKQDSREECISLKKKLAEGLGELFPGAPLILINRVSYYAMGELPAPGISDAGKPAVYFSKLVETHTPEFLAEFRQSYVESVCDMRRSHPVYLMRPVPEMPVMVPLALGRALLLGKQIEVSISIAEYRKRHAFVWDMQDEAVARCGAHILDPLPYLCDEERCYGSRNGWPLYVDDDHLSEFGNRLLVPMFAPVFSTPIMVAE